MTILLESEIDILEQIWAYLDETHFEESRQVKEQFGYLEQLGTTVSQYPPIRSAQIIWGENSLVETLINPNLCSNKFYMPPRVTLTNGLLVAKIQAFSMLSSMVKDIDAFRAPLRSSIFSLLCIFITEKVYCACLKDPSFPQDTKPLLAEDLITLWDSGPDPKNVRFFPFLARLWHSRDGTPPVFGTMDGNFEILMLSENMTNDWNAFLVKETDNDETQWALQEFIFGLSFEDIRAERDRLLDAGVLAVGQKDVFKYFESVQPTYKGVKPSDPKMFYNFFMERHQQAIFRRRKPLPGPKRTIEELYLEYITTEEVQPPTE
jgi:hypothetical protein